MKHLILFFAFSFTFTLSTMGEEQVKGPLQITWFGTTCINISDGKDALFFDPFINHPSVWEIISLQEYSPSQKYLQKWLSKIDIKEIKGIFLSHTHYDHALDLVGLAKLAPQAKVYASSSAQKILNGANINSSRFQEAKWNQVINVGDFKVTILPAIHAPHLFSFTIGSGPIEKDIGPSAAIFKYKMGKLYNYLVEHPRGNILFHPSGHITLTANELKKIKTPLVIQGIYSRKSDDDLINNIFKVVGAKSIIAVHHDNFLSPLSTKVMPMVGSKFDEFKKALAKTPQFKLNELTYGEAFIYTPKASIPQKTKK
jgi:L-ascorbate metabolism protein UlaG (beta-lactamase superfamily)